MTAALPKQFLISSMICRGPNHSFGGIRDESKTWARLARWEEFLTVLMAG